jgi:hypothetical protein
MSNFSKKVYSTTIEDAPDGSGDGILTIPPEICEEMGWTEGTVLNVSYENNAIILQEIKNVQNTTASS